MRRQRSAKIHARIADRRRDVPHKPTTRVVRENQRAGWYGRDVIAVDRVFPSAKLCSQCGALQPEMPLNVRTGRETAVARPMTGM